MTGSGISTLCPLPAAMLPLLAGKTKLGWTSTSPRSNGSAETGATIYIDDVYFGKAATSTTGFRNEVVTSLQAINPGSFRYASVPASWEPMTPAMRARSGCTAGNSGPTTSGTCDYLHGPAVINGRAAIGRGLTLRTDAYALDGALGAVPFMTFGNAMNDADLNRLHRQYVLCDQHL